MAIYTVELDGQQFDIEGPDGASEADLLGAARQHAADSQTARQPQPPAESTGLQKAAQFSEGFLDTLTAPIAPVARAIGTTVSGIEEASRAASEREAELAGSKGMLPLSAVVPAIPEILIKGVKKPFELLNRAGEVTAEKVGEAGYPTLGAGLGTAIQMAPDIAAGAQGIAKRAALGAAVESAGKKALAPVSRGTAFVKKVGKALTDLSPEEARIQAAHLRRTFKKGTNLEKATAEGTAKLRETEKVLGSDTAKLQQHISESLDPLKKRVSAGTKELKSLPEKQLAKKQQLADLEKQAKGSLEQAEAESGFAFKSSPKFEAKATNAKFVSKLAKRYRPILEKGPEAAAAKMSPQRLQLVRKVFQESGKEGVLTDLGKAGTERLRETAAKALELKSPKFGEARKEFLTVKNAQAALPEEFLKKRTQIQKSLQDAKDTLKKELEGARESKRLVSQSQKEELKRVKDEIDELTRRAKNADAEDFAAIGDKADEIVGRSLESAKLRNKVMAIAKLAGGAGIIGTGLSLLKK